MSTFSENFRRKVTISAALSAMLYSEELSGENTLATRTQIAIENIRSDIQMLAAVDKRFDPNVTEDDAINELLERAYSYVQTVDLLPDEAVECVINQCQKRKFETQQDAQARVDMVRQSFALVNHALKNWAVA